MENASSKTQFALAWHDVTESFKLYCIWQFLAMQDIKLRYRRSVLGPLWVTITMAVTIGAMGVIYAQLFHIAIKDYLPYVTAGMICWALISGLINEQMDTFSGEGLIQQMKLPYFLYINRTIWRNYIILLHNLSVWLVITLIYNRSALLSINLVYIIPALVIIYYNALTLGVILAMLAARYRDIAQIVKNLVQVLFFVTPVMWKADHLSPHLHAVIIYNPIYPFITLMRAPLLGLTPSLEALCCALLIGLINTMLAALIFTRSRRSIIYWL